MSYKTEALWQDETEYEIAEGEELEIILPSTVESAATSFSFLQTVKKNTASDYKYNIQATINLKITYKSTELKPSYFTVFFNRDTEVIDDYFTNSSILSLEGQDIDTITINIKNSDETTLYLHNLSIYESDDVQITTIAKVLQEETIVADLIQTTSVFADSLFTQLLETNARSRSARLATSGQEVEYIRAEGMELGFYTAVLGEDQEQYTITTTTAGVTSTYFYWYAQIEGDDAYKYLTTIDPRTKYPDISDINRDLFRYMVLTPTSLQKKLSFEFASDENGNLTPSAVWGAGTSETSETAGKGFTYKNTNGFYHIYCQSDENVIGIVMDESGVHITGWTDQHCESITFKDNGVKLKFQGEESHSFEYIFDDDEVMTGILQDSQYLTSISYEEGNL